MEWICYFCCLITVIADDNCSGSENPEEKLLRYVHRERQIGVTVHFILKKLYLFKNNKMFYYKLHSAFTESWKVSHSSKRHDASPRCANLKQVCKITSRAICDERYAGWEMMEPCDMQGWESEESEALRYQFSKSLSKDRRPLRIPIRQEIAYGCRLFKWCRCGSIRSITLQLNVMVPI